MLQAKSIFYKILQVVALSIQLFICCIALKYFTLPWLLFLYISLLRRKEWWTNSSIFCISFWICAPSLNMYFYPDPDNLSFFLNWMHFIPSSLCSSGTLYELDRKTASFVRSYVVLVSWCPCNISRESLSQKRNNVVLVVA